MGERGLRKEGLQNWETGSSNIQTEDRVLKTAAQFFGKELLLYGGVGGEMDKVAPTEHIHLEMRRMEEDFNFIMRDGSWIHLEFESDSITERDLRRFREYEAYIGMVYNVPVATYVLCTSNVKVLKRELVNGNSIYRIELIRLKDRNADKVFQKLERKMKKKKRLKRCDVFSLLLTPLMSGSTEISERICRGMEILQGPELDMRKEDVKRMQSVQYALAVKFLDRNQLMEVKEKIGMTILGQMLFEDGEKKGMEQGEERLSRLTLLLMNEKRYDDVEKVLKDKEYRSKMFKSMGV